MPGPVAPIARRGELARLLALVDVARAGSSAALLVHGPAGSGKTTLLEAVIAGSGDLMVLRATGVESEGDFPHAGLAELLEPVLHLREQLPAPRRTALESALALAQGGVAEPFAVAAAVVSLLGLAAEHTPVLCAVDDAQWLDPASLEVVRFAARRLREAAVVWLFCARGDEAPDVDLAPLETLGLPPLDDVTARELVRARGGSALDPRTVGTVVATAGGNPLALVELASELAGQRLARRLGDAEPLPPGRAADALFAGRVALLGDGARRALLVAATSGDCDDCLLAALASSGLDLADLEPAEELGLVDLGGGRPRFRHPLVRSVAYHAAPPSARRVAHRAIATALPESDDRRVWHLAAAALAPDEELATGLDAAAAGARRRGGFATAARAQRRAAELTPDRDRRAHRLVAAAEDAELAGRLGEARALLDEAQQLSGRADVQALVRATAADLELRQGRPASARDILVAEASARAGEGNRAGVLLMKAALAAMLAGDVTGWRAAADRAADLLTQGNDLLAPLARSLAGVARIGAGEAREGERLLEELGDAAVLPVLLRTEAVPAAGPVEVHTLTAHAWIWLERWNRAQVLLDGLVSTLRDLGAVATLIYPLAARSWLDYRLGRWEAALAAASEAVHLGRDTEQRAPLTGALGIRAVIRGVRGDADGCRRDARDGLILSEQISSPLTTTYARHALGLLALGLGRVDEAIEQLELARASCDRAGILEPGARPFDTDLVEAYVRAGRPSNAVGALADHQGLLTAADRPVGRTLVARCEGLLAGDEDFEDFFAEALDGGSLPFERARTLLCLAERRRRSRRLTEARGPLREALAAFDRMGAQPWSRRARIELRATGAAVPAQAPSPLAGLTAHELQVARLVAEGRTNREIAAALFIAPKTVEHHLGRIYRKLRISRRAQLAALAARLRTAPPTA